MSGLQSDDGRSPMSGVRRRLSMSLAVGLLVPDAVAQTRPKQKIHRIGVLVVGGTSPSASAFPDELARLGLREGVDVVTELRSAGGDVTRLEALAAELVDLRPDVIVVGGTRAALILKKATSTTPIVFTAGDPVARGLVASLARPGGNLTGNALVDLEIKRVEILAEVVGPKATIAMLGVAPRSGQRRQEWLAELSVAAGRRPEQFQLVELPDAGAIGPAFETLRRLRVDAVTVVATPVTFHSQAQLAELLKTHRLPAIADGREFAASGGLLAYSVDWEETERRSARYVHKILNGMRPADLPVELTSRYKLIVNSRTAKSLGIDVPRSILLRADEVIE